MHTPPPSTHTHNSNNNIPPSPLIVREYRVGGRHSKPMSGPGRAQREEYDDERG